MTKLKLLSCEVMRAEIEWLLADMGLDGAIDVDWFEMGLHQQPEKLNAELKKRIAACEGQGYDAILLMFGLCSNAVNGLEPPADSRLVIPRVHDCISIYLGSAGRYLAEHAAEPGTYWFSRGFLHRTDGVGIGEDGLGSDFGGMDDDGQRVSAAEMRRRYTEEYGEENADYLMDTLFESWKTNYRRAVYLEWADNPDAEEDRRRVAEYAAENNWEFAVMDADLRLLRDLLKRAWGSGEFVVVEPGQKLAATNAQDALAAVVSA
jgi:Protein of unknown function (DUF1638).